MFQNPRIRMPTVFFCVASIIVGFVKKLATSLTLKHEVKQRLEMFIEKQIRDRAVSLSRHGRLRTAFECGVRSCNINHNQKSVLFFFFSKM